MEKEKDSCISPYLFHLYHRNECLREGKLQEVEVAKECLEYSIGPEVETPPDEEEVGSERESIGSEEQWKMRLSPNSWIKFTYRSSKGKLPVRNPD